MKWPFFGRKAETSKLPIVDSKSAKRELELLVTLWPNPEDFPHFERFAKDNRLSAVRLNSATISQPELDRDLEYLKSVGSTVPLFYDVKGRQLRVTEVHPNPDYLDITINHPIQVSTPTAVLFKAGEDYALLKRMEEGGRRLIFDGGPRFNVRPHESLHIRDESLRCGGSQFTEAEEAKIQKVVDYGFDRYFLSYVQCQRDVDEFRERVGKHCQVWLKIEDKKGLEYVATEFKKIPELVLVVAQGDMYVELERPHEILQANKLIIEKDPEACAGSRLLLSVIVNPAEMCFTIKKIIEQHVEDSVAARLLCSIIGNSVPSCADFQQLAWLYEIGFRKMMLCDELCLKEDLLATAINAFCAFKEAIV